MMIGEKIKALRKAKRLTQEQLADYLTVSSQAVSKWETGASCPDIDMLPRLAVFFGTSVDDLLDFDRRRIDAEVDRLVEASVPLRAEPEKAEAFYREALKKYPNNEVLLNCLLMAIPNSRYREKLDIGERLLDATADDEIRLDVLRILALACHRAGEQAMAESYLNRLPELYFLKTEIAAAIREGEARQAEIEKTEDVCLMTLGNMLRMRAEGAASPAEKARFQALLAALMAPFLADPAFSGRAERIADELNTGTCEDYYQ